MPFPPPLNFFTWLQFLFLNYSTVIIQLPRPPQHTARQALRNSRQPSPVNNKHGSTWPVHLSSSCPSLKSFTGKETAPALWEPVHSCWLSAFIHIDDKVPELCSNGQLGPAAVKGKVSATEDANPPWRIQTDREADRHRPRKVGQLQVELRPAGQVSVTASQALGPWGTRVGVQWRQSRNMVLMLMPKALPDPWSDQDTNTHISKTINHTHTPHISIDKTVNGSLKGCSRSNLLFPLSYKYTPTFTETACYTNSHYTEMY